MLASRQSPPAPYHQRVGELEPDAPAFLGGIEVARGDRVVTLQLVPPLVADV